MLITLYKYIHNSLLKKNAHGHTQKVNEAVMETGQRLQKNKGAIEL